MRKRSATPFTSDYARLRDSALLFPTDFVPNIETRRSNEELHGQLP